MRHVYLLVFLCCSLLCTAQNSFKNKKEEQIKKVDFPKNALELLDKTLPKEIKKVTYYKEQDSVNSSYKIKLAYKDQKYSIAFSKEGNLENVVVTIQQKHIPPKTLEKIKKHFYNTYSSFRIKKIQRQYRNTKNDTADNVIKDAFSNDEKRSYHYEIIAEVKTKKKRYFIEITFTTAGDFESSSE
jgi:hypothetical protein